MGWRDKAKAPVDAESGPRPAVLLVVNGTVALTHASGKRLMMLAICPDLAPPTFLASANAEK